MQVEIAFIENIWLIMFVFMPCWLQGLWIGWLKTKIKVYISKCMANFYGKFLCGSERTFSNSYKFRFELKISSWIGW
jgi:hypothetical protein